MITTALFALVTSQVFVDRGTYTIHLESMGSGKPMVAIAGGPGFSGRTVWAIGYDLQDTARVLLFDQLGTGGSKFKPGKKPTQLSIDKTVDDLEATRKKLGYKKWDVFGQSWGALVAGLYVTKYPNSVDRLCLASLPGLDMDDYMVLGQSLQDRVPEDYETETRKMLWGKENDERTSIRIFRDSVYYFYDVETAQEYAKRIPETLFSPATFGAMYGDINQQNFDRIKVGLKKWSGRTLIQHGHQDPTGGAMGYKWASYGQNSTVKMYNRCGHFSWLEPSITNTFFTDMRAFLGLKPPAYSQNDFFSATRAGLDLRRKLDGWPFGYVPSPSK